MLTFHLEHWLMKKPFFWWRPVSCGFCFVENRSICSLSKNTLIDEGTILLMETCSGRKAFLTHLSTHLSCITTESVRQSYIDQPHIYRRWWKQLMLRSLKRIAIILMAGSREYRRLCRQAIDTCFLWLEPSYMCDHEVGKQHWLGQSCGVERELLLLITLCLPLLSVESGDCQNSLTAHLGECAEVLLILL